MSGASLYSRGIERGAGSRLRYRRARNVAFARPRKVLKEHVYGVGGLLSSSSSEQFFNRAEERFKTSNSHHDAGVRQEEGTVSN